MHSIVVFSLPITPLPAPLLAFFPSVSRVPKMSDVKRALRLAGYHSNPAPSDRLEISARRSSPKIWPAPFRDSAPISNRTDDAPNWPVTAESCHYREKYLGPSVTIFRRLLAELEPGPCRGHQVSLFVFAFFTPAITLPFAARWSDTEPAMEARSKTAPASPICPFATVTVLAFAGF